MKLAKILSIIMMSSIFFIIACGDDSKEEETKNATVCTESGNECKNNTDGKTECVEQKCVAPKEITIDTCTESGNECKDNTNGKTECVELKCVAPASTTFGKACTKSDHSECAETEVCIPSMASNYGMTNAETCSTINCKVVIENEKPTQSDCPSGYYCVSLMGDYSSFRPALKNAESICVTMAEE